MEKNNKETKEDLKNETITYAEVYDDVKKMIEEKKIKTNEEVKEYVESTKLKDSEKAKICEEMEPYIAGEVNEEDIIQVRNQILGIINTSRSKDEDLYILFNVSHNNVGSTLCKINIFWNKHDHNKKYRINSFYYNEEFKRQMIEAIVEDVILNNYVDDYYFEQSDSTIDTLYNYYLNTINKIHINLFDIEKEYAYYLREKINELVVKKRTNTNDRIKQMESDGIIEPEEDKSLTRIRVRDSY